MKRRARAQFAVTTLVALAAPARATSIPPDPSDDVMVRARILAVEPSGPVRLEWRSGGEGLGGNPIHGKLTTEPIRPRTWSEEAPLSSMGGTGHPGFVTFTATLARDVKSTGIARDAVFEVQFRYRGKVVDDVVEKGPEGATATIRVAFDRLNPGKPPASDFGKETMGLPEYAAARLGFLKALPWSRAPVPRRFAVITDLYGYGEGTGYRIRTTDRSVIETELAALRQLGVNGLRSPPDFVTEAIRAKTGIEREFGRVKITTGLGYPVPLWDAHQNPASGCPYQPDLSGFRENGRARARELIEKTSADTFLDEEWLLEVDEIGSVFDRAREGKAHQGICPYCREAFRDVLRGAGLSPIDFGAESWKDIRSTYGYWGLPKPGEPAPLGLPPMHHDGEHAALSAPGWALLHYYSRRFNADSSAMLLEPIREAFEAANDDKRRAFAEGKLDAPETKRPWLYTYALRTETFLQSGHSLDLFDFYRHADTGFVYETSNRDPRVWSWDGYMNDIGRMLSNTMGKRFGVYVKPHRGAVIQRALSAASRGAKMLFWYTYGPDWVKGDSFAQSKANLAPVSRAARLLAASEDVLYDAQWAVPAEIAVVRPRTSEYFESDASWENGKWIYAALTHAHFPVDPLDEGAIEVEDLSRYKVIYVSGSHIRESAGRKLAEWVARGGVLYTSGFGLALNEANEPLEGLAEALGLQSRRGPELWNDVVRYGATALPPLRKIRDAPVSRTVSGQGAFSGSFDAVIGRETLDPKAGTEVLATFSDGTPALTRHRQGRGLVYVAGFFAGDEYGSDVMQPTYDMSKDFSAQKRAFIEAPAVAAHIEPVVDSVGAPLVEGVLLKNPSTGKRAVSLMNWAYRTVADTHRPDAPRWELVPREHLTVRVRGAGDAHRVVSSWTGHELSASREGDWLVLKLPRLDEGDVLLLE